MRLIFALSVIINIFGTVAIAQDQESLQKKAAEIIVSSYNAQEFSPISDKLDPEAAKQLTPDILKRFLTNHFAQYGRVTKIGEEKTVNGATSKFPLVFEKGEFELTIAVNKEEKVLGFSLTPVAPKTFEQNSVDLRLPFDGEWYVFWGGDTAAENYHQDFPNQRFAFDFVKVDENEKTHIGDGSKNEDYYAFGERILAPADGVVTDVVNGVRDNAPGVMNPLMALGNTVIIRHAKSEYSVYAHLKQNSAAVNVGQKVSTGDLIGLCGNSGNTSEAHLHFQIQKSNLFQNEGSKKVFFSNVNTRKAGSTEWSLAKSVVKGERVSFSLDKPGIPSRRTYK